MLWWNDNLATGVKTIDDQHKSIFDKANEIFDMGKNTKPKELKEIISFLISYTNNHFLDEEQLMLENHYGSFIEHREQHNLFVKEIYKIYLRANNEEINEELFNDLKVLIIQWLANHINNADKKFVDFYREVK